MTRWRLLALLACLLLIPKAQAGPIDDWGDPNQMTEVRQGSEWTIKHIGTIVHVAIVSGASGGPLSTNVAHISGVTHVTGQVRAHYSGAIRAWQVSACGGTPSLAIASNDARRDLILKNIGGGPNAESSVIWVGFGTTGHVALANQNGFPLGIHFSTSPAFFTAPLVLENYQGPVACLATANHAVLSVIEVLR